MNENLCPKCLCHASGQESYCNGCGTKLVVWDLKCHCGTELPPYFRYSFNGNRIPKPHYKYCSGCGNNVETLVERHTKYLQKAFRQST